MNIEYSPLARAVERSISEFLHTAESEQITNFYDKVVTEVELAVLRATMDYCEGNQSKATAILGMSRATLRKKLECHQLLYYGKDKDTRKAKNLGAAG
jgi:Fis family transcriptional regulator